MFYTQKNVRSLPTPATILARYKKALRKMKFASFTHDETTRVILTYEGRQACGSEEYYAFRRSVIVALNYLDQEEQAKRSIRNAVCVSIAALGCLVGMKLFLDRA